MTTSCGRARRLLWPDSSPKVVTPAIEAAQRHLDTCEECQRFLLEMQHLAALAQKFGPRPAAPREIRDRLVQAVARARADVPAAGIRRGRTWAALGIVALLIAGLMLQRQSQTEHPRDATAGLAEDHMRATRGEGLRSDDTVMVSRWLAARLPFAMDVPVLPDLTLRGARLCVMDGERGGVVEYSADGRTLSYFVLPDRSSSMPPRSPGELHRAAWEGYHIVSWREPGLLHAFVSELPEQRLVELARLCMSRVMAVLSSVLR